MPVDVQCTRMARVSFSRTPLVLGRTVRRVSERTIARTPSLVDVSLADAIRHGGPLVQRVLAAMALRHDRRHIVVLVQVAHLARGDIPNGPGWHTDGVAVQPRRYRYATDDPEIPAGPIPPRGRGRALPHGVRGGTDLARRFRPRSTSASGGSTSRAGWRGSGRGCSRSPAIACSSTTAGHSTPRWRPEPRSGAPSCASPRPITVRHDPWRCRPHSAAPGRDRHEPVGLAARHDAQ